MSAECGCGVVSRTGHHHVLIRNVLHCRTVDNNHVGLRQLGQNVSRVMERVKRGEILVVTEFGKPIAKISPVREPQTLEEAIEMGQITPASADLAEFLAQEPLPSGDGETLSETLERMRRDER